MITFSTIFLFVTWVIFLHVMALDETGENAFLTLTVSVPWIILIILFALMI